MDETNLEFVNLKKQMFTQTHNVGGQNQTQTGTKIYETMNYEIFSLVRGNRELSGSKVDQLVHEIKLNGLLMPIMVNSAMQVIDGQHRLAACKTAKVPVQYFVRANATVETAANVNMAGSNWSPSDWINKYASEGKEDYIILKNWIEKCKGYKINQSSAIFMAQNSAAMINYIMHSDGIIRQNGSAPKGVKKLYRVGTDIRLGKWACGDMSVAEDLLSAVLMFQSWPFYGKQGFVAALLRASRINKFDVKTLHSQAMRQPKKFTHQSTAPDFLRMFEEVYNFGRAQKNRLAIVNNPELKQK